MPTITTHPSTIMLQQLGGQRFVAMTGASQFVSRDTPHPMLRFRIPKRPDKGGATHFQVTLMPDDTYALELFKFYNSQKRLIATARGVYCDMLREQFTAMTGLRTSL